MISRHRSSKFKINSRIITRILAELGTSLGLDYFELSVTFASARKMQKLNATFREKDYPTDVLSFPQFEWKKPLTTRAPFKTKITTHRSQNPQILGDIVICLDMVAKNAQSLSHGIDREACFLLVHGLLHLCGHDHEKPKEEKLMLGEQKVLMEQLRKKTQQPLWLNCVEAGRQ